MTGREAEPQDISPRELGITPSELTAETRITPGLLLADNKSESSRRLRREWDVQRADGELTLEHDCDDARNYLSLRTAQRRSISIGGDTASSEAFTGLFNDPGIKRIAVVIHYDRETVRKGKAPEGCGGLEVKKKQKCNEAPKQGGAYGYVDRSVPHEDPIIQAIKSADQTSRLTTKPILVGARDHLTGEIRPISLFQEDENGVQLTYSAVRVGDILDGSYNPEEIYANGMPFLDKTDPMLRTFYTFFVDNEYEVRTLADRYPDLRDRMKVQNPKAIVISTQVRPIRTRYRDVLGGPGTAFEVTIARGRKTLEAASRITNKAIEEALCQAHYAMSHAMDNREKAGKPFRDTHTIIVETTHLDESRRIAQALAQTDYGARWLNEGNDVIIAEVRGGEIVDGNIEYFHPTV